MNRYHLRLHISLAWTFLYILIHLPKWAPCVVFGKHKISAYVPITNRSMATPLSKKIMARRYSLSSMDWLPCIPSLNLPIREWLSRSNNYQVYRITQSISLPLQIPSIQVALDLVTLPSFMVKSQLHFFNKTIYWMCRKGEVTASKQESLECDQRQMFAGSFVIQLK